jgi:hypothetical protein
MLEVQKDSEDISAGISCFLKEFFQKFDVQVSKVNFDLAWYI